MSSLPHQYHITTLIAVLLPMGELKLKITQIIHTKQETTFSVLLSSQ